MTDNFTGLPFDRYFNHKTISWTGILSNIDKLILIYNRTDYSQYYDTVIGVEIIWKLYNSIYMKIINLDFLKSLDIPKKYLYQIAFIDFDRFFYILPDYYPIITSKDAISFDEFLQPSCNLLIRSSGINESKFRCIENDWLKSHYKRHYIHYTNLVEAKYILKVSDLILKIVYGKLDTDILNQLKEYEKSKVDTSIFYEVISHFTYDVNIQDILENEFNWLNKNHLTEFDIKVDFKNELTYICITQEVIDYFEHFIDDVEYVNKQLRFILKQDKNIRHLEIKNDDLRDMLRFLHFQESLKNLYHENFDNNLVITGKIPSYDYPVFINYDMNLIKNVFNIELSGIFFDNEKHEMNVINGTIETLKKKITEKLFLIIIYNKLKPHEVNFIKEYEINQIEDFYKLRYMIITNNIKEHIPRYEKNEEELFNLFTKYYSIGGHDLLKSSSLIEHINKLYDEENVPKPPISIDILLSRVLKKHEVNKKKLSNGIFWIGVVKKNV